MSRFRMVVDPGFNFHQIEAVLASLGWRRAADMTRPPPLITGEPDAAAWSRPGTDTAIVYTFHPAMALRVLMLEGGDTESCCEELGRHLPTLSLDPIRKLLQSASIESILLGIHAADVLEAYALAVPIADLRNHPDELVAKEADRVCRRLLNSAGAYGLGILAEWKSRHPDLSALFPIVGGSRERNQLLRWLIRDQRESNPNIDAVLRTGLQDPDWEVRATAMLAAARLDAAGVQKAVRSAPLPAATREGLNASERRMLEAIRRAALDLLAGQTPPPLSDVPPATREAMQAHILRCVAGFPVSHFDRVFLLIHSLTEPLPVDSPRPDRLPYGITPSPDGYRMAWGDLALCWVPPVSHWLGDDLPRMRIANPIRRHSPERGFFIGRKRFVPPGQSGPCTCIQSEATQWCQKILRQTGLPVRLPTADEWEMAARGPDGRRFPWGNNADVPVKDSASPWGVQDLIAAPGEWTGTPAASGDVVTCGGSDPVMCAMRTACRADAPGMGFRFVIPC